MKGGWLEHEIRSLPQVLACSITPDDIVVLTDVSADPSAVEQRVRDVLRRAGVDTPVRVYGGERPVFVEPMRIRNGKAALVGTIGGATLLAAGVWLAGATTALRGPKGKNAVVTLAPPPPKKLVLIPAVGGEGPPDHLPAQETTPPLLRPVRKPVLGSEHRVSRPGRPAGDPTPVRAPQPAPSGDPDPQHRLLDVGRIFDRIVLGGALR
jgi:hypothetical protein